MVKAGGVVRGEIGVKNITCLSFLPPPLIWRPSRAMPLLLGVSTRCLHKSILKLLHKGVAKGWATVTNLCSLRTHESCARRFLHCSCFYLFLSCVFFSCFLACVCVCVYCRRRSAVFFVCFFSTIFGVSKNNKLSCHWT